MGAINGVGGATLWAPKGLNNSAEVLANSFCLHGTVNLGGFGGKESDVDNVESF